MMPDRMIRDELLTSERYWSISGDARIFYIHLLLNADDTARFSGKNYTLRAACFPGQAVDPEKIERMLLELSDTDLIRIYLADGERFIFVPRFKQRLRFVNSRYPEPPSEISDIHRKKTDSSQSQVMRKPVLSTAHAMPETAEEKRREEKRREVLQDVPTVQVIAPSRDDVPYQKIVELYHAKLPELPQCIKLTAARRAQIRARWKGKDAEDLQDWEAYFDLIRKSRFLMGMATPTPGRKVFRADLDWLTREANFTKVLEGKYS